MQREEPYFLWGEVVPPKEGVVMLVVWEGAVVPAEEFALDSGNGITSIETRNAVPLIAATASWATGLTGSMEGRFTTC